MALAVRMSDEARIIAAKYFRKNFSVETKPDQSPVTIADREIEATQRQMIEETYPDHGISGEEYGNIRLDAHYVWVLDPIDGTKAFLNGIPVYTNLIGLTFCGNPILGVIDQPNLSERWIGASGYRTTLNSKIVRTSGVTELSAVTVHATSPEMFELNTFDTRFNALATQTKYRRYGTDCYAYGLLASGHLHLVAEAGLKVQDFLPVVEIVRQAGGTISDWSGQPLGFNSDGTVLASASDQLHTEALQALSL